MLQNSSPGPKECLCQVSIDLHEFLLGMEWLKRLSLPIFSHFSLCHDYYDPNKSDRSLVLLQNSSPGTNEYLYQVSVSKQEFLLGMERLKRPFFPFSAILAYFSNLKCSKKSERSLVMLQNSSPGTKECLCQVSIALYEFLLGMERLKRS